MSVTQRRKEYMRLYMADRDKRWPRRPCTVCGTRRTTSVTGVCADCADDETYVPEDLKLSPDACLQCGIRPAPEYDAPGRYVPVVVDNLCDDCRLRHRRLSERWGSAEWKAAHTPRSYIEGKQPSPLYESGYSKITDIPLYLVAGDARDAHA